MTFQCASRTHVGLVRKVNEDSLLIRTDCGLWAVADGMGGHDAGDVASSKVSESLRALPRVHGLDELVNDAVAALGNANRELIELAAAIGSKSSIGSTVVGLAVAGLQYRCFWAGDSRAYQVRDGQIVQLTRDHSLVESLIQAGMLTPDEAANHPNSNIITRAVGVSDELNVETIGGQAQPGDIFLLATDGLTRIVSDQEMLAELTSHEPEEAADRLIETVLDRGAPDNVTIIIAKLL